MPFKALKDENVITLLITCNCFSIATVDVHLRIQKVLLSAWGLMDSSVLNGIEGLRDYLNKDQYEPMISTSVVGKEKQKLLSEMDEPETKQNDNIIFLNETQQQFAINSGFIFTDENGNLLEHQVVNDLPKVVPNDLQDDIEKESDDQQDGPDDQQDGPDDQQDGSDDQQDGSDDQQDAPNDQQDAPKVDLDEIVFDDIEKESDNQQDGPDDQQDAPKVGPKGRAGNKRKLVGDQTDEIPKKKKKNRRCVQIAAVFFHKELR